MSTPRISGWLNYVKCVDKVYIYHLHTHRTELVPDGSRQNMLVYCLVYCVVDVSVSFHSYQKPYSC